MEWIPFFIVTFLDTDLMDQHGLKDKFFVFSDAKKFNKSVFNRVLLKLAFTRSLESILTFLDTDLR